MLTDKKVIKKIHLKHPLQLASELNSKAREFIKIKLFDLCEHCLTMPALPPGAFAACKVSAQLRKQDLKQQLYGDTKMEYGPVKYNGKFMNAIWGHYNRYSPHNIKSNECDLKFGVQTKQQQQ